MATAELLRGYFLRVLGDMAAVAALIATGAGIYYAFTRNKRETISQAQAEAATTIALLEKQNALLESQLVEAKRQGEEREAEWRNRETEWRRERDDLKKRVDELDRDYRNLVLTVTTMGFCANSGTCRTYNPGDRRSRPDTIKPGGTD